jgi:hypothetical protein
MIVVGLKIYDDTAPVGGGAGGHSGAAFAPTRSAYTGFAGRTLIYATSAVLWIALGVDAGPVAVGQAGGALALSGNAGEATGNVALVVALATVVVVGLEVRTDRVVAAGAGDAKIHAGRAGWQASPSLAVTVTARAPTGAAVLGVAGGVDANPFALGHPRRAPDVHRGIGDLADVHGDLAVHRGIGDLADVHDDLAVQRHGTT